MEMLRRDLRLLETLLEAEGDTTVEAPDDKISNPIAEMLEQLIRQTIGQLERESVYCPLPSTKMPELVEKLRWAVEANVTRIFMGEMTA